MPKINCWEFKKCGREQGGAKSQELGVCPAYLESGFNGVHGGKNGGRACWVLAGTLCGGKVQGSFASKSLNCMICEFYKKVQDEEGANFISASKLMPKIRQL